MKTIKTALADVKQLCNSITELNANVDQLKKSWPAVTEFLHEAQGALDRWQCKDQARIDKIQAIVDRLSKRN